MNPTHPMTQEEIARLAECEIVIHAGLQNFVQVGAALLEISDKRLYRGIHSTFDEYVKAQWQMTASRAYQLCEAAEVVKDLPAKSQNILRNDAQAREAKKAPKEKRAQVVETAAARAESESRPMTAKDVKEAVLEVCEPAVEPSPDPEIPTADHKQLARQLEDITCQLQNWLAMAGAANEKEKAAIRKVFLVLSRHVKTIDTFLDAKP